MKTPDGRECPYYYADFHRRSPGVEICRLLQGTPDADEWTSDYCRTCPVPEIRRANACPHMTLKGRIGRRYFWERRRVLVEASCSRSAGPVTNPYVGCGKCHETIEFVVVEPPEDVP